LGMYTKSISLVIVVLYMRMCEETVQQVVTGSS